MNSWPMGAHGSTYGGSPIPCAAGIATIEVIQGEGLLENAQKVGKFLLEGLAEVRKRFPEQVTDVRGVGLMIGVEFTTEELAEAVQNAAFERGLLVLECGASTIRMSPPLVVSTEQAETALRLFAEAIDACR